MSMSFPVLTADLLLLHPPAFFDFRNREDIYFPFLSTSGDVPITPLYEYFPVGFKTLQRYLSQRDHEVKIINLSSILLRYPKLDIDELIRALDVRILGIDLHWMVHVQGCLSVAHRVKHLRSEIPILIGGISSTYYADELIRYSCIDMVMRGYNTHEPVALLLESIKQGLEPVNVPNLLWKSADGVIHKNEFLHKPLEFGGGLDWSNHPSIPKDNGFPILEVVSPQTAGCKCNCGWCGGSRDAFRRIYNQNRTVIRKSITNIRAEFESLSKDPNGSRYHFYSVGSYNETNARMKDYLDIVEAADIKSISYEQYSLTPDDTLKRMAKANRRTTITLSPESHDIRISKLCGRGVYTNEELEDWIRKALDYGIHQIDIWYFIGMPEQDEQSVWGTVDYSLKLLEIFKNKRVNPMLCPMIPYLDPGSNFFTNPDRYGYRIFYKTVEEHRSGMERASIINRINYETKWLSRNELIHVGYEAVKSLMEAKAEAGRYPKKVIDDYNAKIDDALAFIDVVHEVDNIPDAKTRLKELEKLSGEIQRRNDMIFFSGVANQAFPVNRKIGGRWFDEIGWDPEILDGLHEPESI